MIQAQPPFAGDSVVMSMPSRGEIASGGGAPPGEARTALASTRALRAEMGARQQGDSTSNVLGCPVSRRERPGSSHVAAMVDAQRRRDVLARVPQGCDHFPRAALTILVATCTGCTSRRVDHYAHLGFPFRRQRERGRRRLRRLPGGPSSRGSDAAIGGTRRLKNA
jgi:hypothetical protein